MSDSPQTPPDLENQLSGPGGQFPGTAETLATPVGSDKPVRVKIGQADNRHLQLSKEEYRARSAHQRKLDAQADANTDQNQEPPKRSVSRPDPAAVAPTPKKRGPPRGSKNKPKPTGAQAKKPIGQPCPAPSTTVAPAPPIPVPTDAMLEERMSRLECGMDMIVQALAERDERRDWDRAQAQDATGALAELDEEFEDDPGDGSIDEEHLECAPEPGESCDEPPERVVATRVDDDSDLDKGLQELQQMILKRNPQKLFRQYWAQLTRLAQYNEWPPERREAFDQVFNSMVAHPKLIHQMSKFLRGSRNGNCIGNEQIARVCGMVAGFLTVYNLAAAGK